jgi:hypothetical protein
MSTWQNQIVKGLFCAKCGSDQPWVGYPHNSIQICSTCGAVRVPADEPKTYKMIDVVENIYKPIGSTAS